MCEIKIVNEEREMTRREQFLRELRKQARKDGKTLSVTKNQGKGSHYRVTYGGRPPR